eukprot:2865403-Amphidinium_carterae.1
MEKLGETIKQWERDVRNYDMAYAGIHRLAQSRERHRDGAGSSSHGRRRFAAEGRQKKRRRRTQVRHRVYTDAGKIDNKNKEKLLVSVGFVGRQA